MDCRHLRTCATSLASGQTLHALRVLRAHGMPDEALQVVFRSVVVGRLLYASCAWSGFVTATDRKRVDAFLRRSKRMTWRHTLRRLFSRISTNSLHVLYDLLSPPSTASQHCLRGRSHHFSLPYRSTDLAD